VTIAGTARDLQHLRGGPGIAACGEQGRPGQHDQGLQGVLPALSCYPALVRKWRKGKLTAAQRKELTALMGRFDLLLTQVKVVLATATGFTGKVMTRSRTPWR